MSALVTGCAGFVGSRLCERLLRAGHDVVGVDALTDLYDPRTKDANLRPLREQAGFRFVRADLRTDELRPLVGADAVFHLAARPGPRDSWGAAFGDYLDHNVLATQRLLEACRAERTGRLVFASSSSVYGDAGSGPGTPALREDAPCHPRSPYGVTKLAAERLVQAYGEHLAAPPVILRYFTVYGPGQRPDMAIHRFVAALLAGEAIEVFGDGDQSRDLTFVEDAVGATVAAASAPPGYSPINVAGGSVVTVNDLIARLAAITGRPARVARRPAPAGDVRHTRADLARARAALGFRPRVGLGEGLERQVAWHTETMAGAR